MCLTRCTAFRCILWHGHEYRPFTDGTSKKDGDNEKRKAFNQLTGVQSSLNENLVPEQFFNDPNAIQKNAEAKRV